MIFTRLQEILLIVLRRIKLIEPCQFYYFYTYFILQIKTSIYRLLFQLFTALIK